MLFLMKMSYFNRKVFITMKKIKKWSRILLLELRKNIYYVENSCF